MNPQTGLVSVPDIFIDNIENIVKFVKISPPKLDFAATQTNSSAILFRGPKKKSGTKKSKMTRNKSQKRYSPTPRYLDPEYVFFRKWYNQQIHEEDTDKDTNKMEQYKLRYGNNGEWYLVQYKYYRSYYYIFECPCTIDADHLTKIQPDEIESNKPYLLHSCLHNHIVKLKRRFERTLTNDNGMTYPLHEFIFELSEKQTNGKPNKYISNPLSLYAYEDNGLLKWKKHNTYPVFDPQASKIMTNVLSRNVRMNTDVQGKITSYAE